MTDEDDGGPRIVLPPINLPPLFPDDLRVRVPPWARPRGEGSPLLAAVALDALDAAAVLTVGGGLPRVALGTALAVVLAGAVGLAYAWEAAAVLAAPRLALVPSATPLVLLRRLR